MQRGRVFEIEPELVDYYRFLWKDYDSWIKESYHASSIIDVDVDKKDILLNPQDRAWLLAEIAKFKKA